MRSPTFVIFSVNIFSWNVIHAGKRVDVMSTVVETSRLPLQRSIAYGDFANTRCKKSSKLGFNSFNCKIYNTRLSQPTRQHLELPPARGDIANGQCLRRREVYLPKGAPLGFITKWLRGGSATRDLLLCVLSN